MREIQPTLTAELQAHVGSSTVARAKAFPIARYVDLVAHVARLAYLNKDHLLFFRGQGADYRNKAGGSSLYPTIYRGDPLPKWEVQTRFDRLEQAGRSLAAAFRAATVDGHADVRRKRYIQWSILQHYGVCETPLLDLTHSLWVACSFAELDAQDRRGFVYVIGLPQLTNRISINSEHDIVNVRLLGICPPAALRPFFQEGYVVGTPDILDDYESKPELDFNSRLIAKFTIPGGSAFWGQNFGAVPQDLLYPERDTVKQICDAIGANVEQDMSPGEIGAFLNAWTTVERILLERSADATSRVLNVAHAITALAKVGLLSFSQAADVDRIRRVRNSIVHGHGALAPGQLRELIARLQRIARAVRKQSS